MNHKWTLSKENFSYILRYYLPCLPRYEEEVTKRRMDELVDFCIKNKVNTVMFYVDLNPHWYYMPDTLEHTEYMIPLLVTVAEKLRKAGISYQLNYQDLFGAWDGNVDHRKNYSWGCYVDEFGEESMGSGCMIDEEFRKLAGKKLSLWAKTLPDAIWIDDDFRYHNHVTEEHRILRGEKPTKDMDFGCFCENHIREFNKRYGFSLDREAIRQELLKEGTPSDIAKKWRIFLNDCYTDTSAWIEKTIHDVSPDTRVALMTSTPDVHAIEGRNWGTMLSALCGEHRPLLRPTFGPYSEEDPRDFAESYLITEQLRTNIISQYGENVDYCPEIENTRFTVYSKSLSATSYQIMLSAFQGFSGVTLSIFDLEGCVLEEEPEFGRLLTDRKSFCDKVNKIVDDSYLRYGAALVTSPDKYVNAEKEKSSGRISEVVQKRVMDELLANAGIPCVYSTPEDLHKYSLVILDQNAVKQLTDDELISCLSKGVFADAGGAKEIGKRGFGKYTGVDVGEKNLCIVASENLYMMKHNDGSDVYVPSRIRGNEWREVTLSGAEAQSVLISPDGKEHVGFTFFKNELGGRVCVYAADGGFGDGFYTNYRIRMLRKLFSMLADDVIIPELTNYGVCAVRENEKNAAVFISNLSADATENIVVNFPKDIKKAYIINKNGKEIKVKSKGNKVVISEKLHLYEALVLCVQYK